jgi:glyoxylase-like metal-dependent hydrolase (beta-lactamase superfamily II)
MRITEVAPGVHAVESVAVSWTLVEDGDALTLIDAGYPGDHDTLIRSIRAIGHQPSDIRAVLVTHGHVDHIGSLPQLLANHPSPVLTSEREAAHVRREHLEQATPLDVAKNLWRPGAVRWSATLVRLGAMKDVSVPRASAFESSLELPGNPVPIDTAGHTSGHTAYLLPEARVLVTGDALVNGHPLLRHTGPQRLPGFFDHDPTAVEQTYDAIAAVDADAIIPGHGPVFRGTPAEAVAALKAS